MDGLTKHELVDFLAEVSSVDRNAFQEFSIQKNCAYFDVAEGKDTGFGEKFDGVEIEGREVRVNRDDSRAPRTGGRSSGGRGGRSFGGGSDRNRSGGGSRGKFSGNRRSSGGGDSPRRSSGGESRSNSSSSRRRR